MKIEHVVGFFYIAAAIGVIVYAALLLSEHVVGVVVKARKARRRRNDGNGSSSAPAFKSEPMNRNESRSAFSRLDGVASDEDEKRRDAVKALLRVSRRLRKRRLRAANDDASGAP